MEIMNLGFPEMIFLFLFALILFGPKKLPEIGRQIGRALNEFKRASNEFKAQIESEISQLDLEQQPPDHPAPSPGPSRFRSLRQPASPPRFLSRRRIRWPRPPMPEMAAELPPADDSRDGLTAMSFLDHLEELRRRLIYSIIAVTVGFFACWNYHEFIFSYVQRPIMDALHRNGMAEKLVYLNPTEPFNLYLKVAALAGLFVTSPFVLYQVWMFISPGLYRNEKRYVFPFMFSTVLLFLSGGLFAYKMVYPAALTFLIDYGKQFQPMITIGEYTDLFLTIMIGMGVIFELPILVFFLSLMGIVNCRLDVAQPALLDPGDLHHRRHHHSDHRHPEHVHFCRAHGRAVHHQYRHRLAGPPQTTQSPPSQKRSMRDHPQPRRGGRPRPPSRAQLGSS